MASTHANAVYAEDHGATFDGSTNDVAAVQAAHDAIVATGKRGTLVFPAGKTAKCNSTLTLNASYVFVEGNGAILDFSSLTTGSAIRWLGTVNPPYRQAPNGIERLHIKGNGWGAGVTGMLFDTDVSGSGVSHMTFDRCTIEAFSKGVYLHDGSYVNNFIGCDIFNCSDCIYDVGITAVDSGERQTFIGCTFFNSDRCLSGNGFYSFTDCSFDYVNGPMITVEGAKVNCLGCHFEMGNNASTQPMFSLQWGASLRVMGGQIWLIKSGAPTMPAIVSLLNTNFGEGGAWFSHLHLEGMETSTGAFASGLTSMVYLHDYSSFGAASGFYHGKGDVYQEVAYDPPSGSSWTTTMTVSGARVGDIVLGVSHTQITSGEWHLFGYVSANDTVRVYGRNLAGASADIASGLLRVLVRQI